jgi:hypothetical protein
VTSGLDGLGHVGYVLLFAGQCMLARGMRAGWAMRAAGEVVWIGVGLVLGSTSIVLWGAGALCVDLYATFRPGPLP